MLHNNLAQIVDAHLAQNKSVSLQLCLVRSFVFGGKDPISGFQLDTCAFTSGFLKESCLNAWAKVGAVPLTRQCLSNSQSKTFGDKDSNFNEYLISVQVTNDLSIHALTEGGYNRDLLKIKIITREDTVLMQPHSKERIDKLARASTHGAKIMVMGGVHLMTDDFFRVDI